MTTQTRQFAERYVEYTNAGQYNRLSSLFADDALFLAPNGRELRGRQEIASFYEHFLPSIKSRLRLASFVEQGDMCVYELEAQINDETEYLLSAIDHATLDGDGLVTRFVVYTRDAGR
ncbi:nuclear transport factor 2 family protein [Rhodococcus sp. DMU1]|uniref:YybH family protein n=1 Tax=Rhodococcus sp. DMU1 TaxID=2722825 RepID=UPI00143EE906|nr:nuclear transport factor 2 family protein [Rhodococcus sp. DMU1]QIX53712.1 SnoaL-like domain-containing protein [Rhodococcus sp. DMU1]